MICPKCEFENIPGTDICESCGTDLAAQDLHQPTSDLHHSILTAKLGDIPHPEPNILMLSSTVKDAIDQMRETRHGVTLIVDENHALAGIFTESDVLRRVDVDADVASIPLHTVMTKKPTPFGLTDSMAHALNAMTVGGRRHLALVDAGRPVGIISIRDILRYLRENVL